MARWVAGCIHCNGSQDCGDATPLGQRPLCVLPIVHRLWASARMVQLDGWFRSWVPASVFSAGVVVGRWKHGILLLLILRKFLLVPLILIVHLFVADVVKSFDTVDRGFLDRVLSSLGLPGLVSPWLF